MNFSDLRALESSLPAPARARLTGPLRALADVPLELREDHTIPVSGRAWNLHAGALLTSIQEWRASLEQGPTLPITFNSIREWVNQLIQRRDRILSLTLSVQPFDLFDPEAAADLVAAVDSALVNLASCIESTKPFTRALDSLSTEWLCDQPVTQMDVLGIAFGVDNGDTLRGADGEFSASRVFSHYYLNNGELLVKIVPHMSSLGLPHVYDPLVATSIVGWIVDSEDAIQAYCALDSFYRRLAYSDNALRTSVLDHLGQREGALRQNRVRVNNALRATVSEPGREASALLLADAYKRLIEGPVRQYGWGFHCLSEGAWTPPPMLGQLRDILIADGGWIANSVGRIILPHMRNAEAHETLEWDGVREVFTVEGDTVDPRVVAFATVWADAFARGCEAAVAWFKAHSIDPMMGVQGPGVDDPGRLSSWRRAEAHFGTNGLHVLRADFNARKATIICEEIALQDVNPCFQALVCSSMLLPYVEQFEVYAGPAEDAAISVSADALGLTVPIWQAAISKFAAMPFSTFLPANYSARSRVEDSSRAVRSVAWIALDDVLDALDGSSQSWTADDADLFAKRIELALFAIDQCLGVLAGPTAFRLSAARRALAELSDGVQSTPGQPTYESVNELAIADKIRTMWAAWGPVERVPGIQEPRRGRSDVRVTLRDVPSDLRWRTI